LIKKEDQCSLKRDDFTRHIKTY